MTRGDWQALLRHLQRPAGPKGACDWLLLHDSSSSKGPVVLETLSAPAGLPESIHRYLVLRRDLASVTLMFLQKPGVWEVDDLRSPVVQLSLGALNGAQLVAGRMYCSFGYYGEAGDWVAKNEEFTRCALKLLGRTKRFLNTTDSPHKGLIGPEASQLAARGEIALRDLLD